MDVAEHWHAYRWAGGTRPGDATRQQHSENYAPLEIAQFLLKPRRHVVGTYRNDEAGRDAALDWLRSVATESVHLDESSFPLEDRLSYVADRLRIGGDIVWGYYTTSRSYVTADLISCPRPSLGIVCPYP